MAFSAIRLREAAPFGFLFGLALALRWPLLHATPYGDEAAHFSMARTLGFLDESIFWVGPDEPFRLLPFVLGRPLFALLHAPGAWLGFTGFRGLGIAYAALLAPLAFAVARRAGARWATSAAAGLAVASHPALVVWGARVFPDSLMACFVLAGLWSWLAGRPMLSAVFLVAASWTKESALAAAGSLAVLAVIEAVHRRRTDVRPLAALAADLHVRCACLALVLGVLPLAAGYAAFPRLPGWVMGGELAPALERLWLFSWLVLPVAAASFLPRARPVAAVGLGLLAFYVAYSQLRGGFVQSWYAVLPACIGAACCALVLDAGLRSLRWPRLAAPPVAAAVAFAFLVAIVGSSGLPTILHPLSPAREPGLAESVEFVQAESPGLAAAIAFHNGVRPDTVLELDVYWLWVDFPYSGLHSTTIAYPLLMEPNDVPVQRLATLAERADLVWLQDWGGAFGDAFKQVYQSCEAFTAGDMHAYKARHCPGRGADLERQFQAALAETGQATPISSSREAG